jgi:hypothetical protein
MLPFWKNVQRSKDFALVFCEIFALIFFLKKLRYREKMPKGGISTVLLFDDVIASYMVLRFLDLTTPLGAVKQFKNLMENCYMPQHQWGQDK